MLPLELFYQPLPHTLGAAANLIELYFATYTDILKYFHSEDSFGVSWVSYLAAEECKRAQSFHSKVDALCFVAGRFLLRYRLSQCNPEIAMNRWQLDINQYGKPFLTGPNFANARLPYFNLSHSGNCVALALSFDFELGLDIEKDMTKKRDILGIATMLFTASEQEQLRSLLLYDERAARQLFLKFWCFYEALAKLEGSGLLACNHSWDNRSFQFTEGKFEEPLSQTQCDNHKRSLTTDKSLLNPYFWALCWWK